MGSASKVYNTTIDGVVGYMMDREEGFNFLVLRDITGVQVTLHLTDGAIKDMVERFKAGPHPNDGSDPMASN
jgi:hypothetical protein